MVKAPASGAARVSSIGKILHVSEMNRRRLNEARAAAPTCRKEKNRLSALSSRQRWLDSQEALARRVLSLESQLLICKSRLSRYETVSAAAAFADNNDEDDASFGSAAAASGHDGCTRFSSFDLTYNAVSPSTEVQPDALTLF